MKSEAKEVTEPYLNKKGILSLPLEGKVAHSAG
jgi:hypothetical protein